MHTPYEQACRLLQSQLLARGHAIPLTTLIECAKAADEVLCALDETPRPTTPAPPGRDGVELEVEVDAMFADPLADTERAPE